jgi:hypothetical protein
MAGLSADALPDVRGLPDVAVPVCGVMGGLAAPE